MEQTDTHTQADVVSGAAPVRDEQPPADPNVPGWGTTVIQITNYYAGTEIQRAHTDLIRGGTAGSLQY